jgi:hypothetical protein
MKTTLASFLIFLALLSGANAGKIDPENAGGSPSGTYVLERIAGPTSDFVLRRTKPRTVELKDFKLEGGDSRWPYYQTVWSKDERCFVLVCAYRKQSEIKIYRIDDDKAVQIRLLDMEKYMMSKEEELAKKKGLHLMGPIRRFVDHVRFIDGYTITYDYYCTYGTDTADRAEFLNFFKIRIKGDKASIVSYELK